MSDLAALIEAIQGLRQDLAKGASSKGLDSDDFRPMRVKAVDVATQTQYFYAEGGLFVDCTLEAPVFNLTLQPRRSILNTMPVRPTTTMQITFAYLSQITDAGTTPQDKPCDDPPATGTVATCKATFDIGRLSYQTRTIEIDKLIERANRGVRDDLYFVGDIRGVTSFPPRTRIADDDFVKAGAVRFQQMLLLRSFQKTLAQWMWTGNPADVGQNGAGGGWESFPGLLMLIADDYGAKSWVTGTNCTALNSIVYDFETLAPGGGVVGTDSLYSFLQEIQAEQFDRMDYMGYNSIDTRVAMHPLMWPSIVRFLPCDMAGDGCSTGVVNANSGDAGDNALYNLAARQEMMRTMTITINEMRHPVVLDSNIPITYDAVAKTYQSDLFGIPYSVDGIETFYLLHVDYREFDTALAGIPGTQDARGWTDGGRYHFIIENQRRCFVIDAKVQVAPVFTAPMLAWRLDNVTVPVIKRRSEMPAATLAA